MRIEPVDDRGAYRVTSESGNPYIVQWCCSDDADGDVWHCECPAAGFRPRVQCKHVRAVIKATTPERIIHDSP